MKIGGHTLSINGISICKCKDNFCSLASHNVSELVVNFTSHLGLSVEDLVILTKSVDIFKLDLCLFDINCR